VVFVRSKKHGISKLVRRRLAPVAAVFAVALAGVALDASNAYAGYEVATTQLTLVNGWTDAPYGTNHAGVRQGNVDGVVVFTGAISGGTSGLAFTLPANDRPSWNVYIPVDMCNATKGRLWIAPTGDVTVQAEGSFSNASCFTSLDGASFQLGAASGLPLTLQNNWQARPYGTVSPGVEYLTTDYNGNPTEGSVHLSGAISGGANGSVAFTLPVGYRPSSTTYVPVDMCGATNGRLIISPDGTAIVQQEASTSANATCFTSLDGAWFALSPSPNYQALQLQNGWSSSIYGTATPAVDMDGTTVQFSGAISTSSSNTNTVVFTLPPLYRPSTAVYVSVDMCGATKGRLDIQTNGVVTVQAENGTFSNATCFTSLDGVSFTNWQH
jgi:hypothetical protein